MTFDTFRACATLVLKSVDDGERIIEGIASTARTDHAGDVLEPKGCSYTLPMPLLIQHDRRQPIGTVRAVQVTNSEIKIRARIPKDSGLDYVESAWKQIRAGLVKGLSIGAQPLEAEPIVNRAGRQTGYRYTAWKWLELSAVTLPMNVDATIEMVRAFDDGDPEIVLDAINQSARVAATRARAAAAMASSRRALDEVAPTRPIAALNGLARPGHEASHDTSYAATKARAEAAMKLAERSLADASQRSVHNRVL
jgi:hypothetical protein